MLMTLGVALALGAPAVGRVCQPTGFPGVRPEGNLVQFVGTATADTALAGVPAGMPDTMPGVYGQVVRVHRASAVLAPEVRRALARGEAVLVPWSYARCRTERHLGSARWAKPGARGLFWGRLRDRAHWAGGRPTIDVRWMVEQPYDSVLMERGGFVTPQGETPVMEWSLTAEQLLEFFDLLPPRGVFDDHAPDTTWSIEPLRRWVRAHPTLAARYPANHLLHLEVEAYEQWQVERRARAVRMPIAGTYRIVFTLGTGDSLVAFARTTARVWSVEFADDGRLPGVGDPFAPQPPPVAYGLLAQMALDPAALPSTRRRDPAGQQSEGGLSVGVAPLVETADSTVWHGGFNLLHAAARLAADSALAAAFRRAQQTMWARGDELEREPGRFVLDRAGRVRFESAVRAGGALLLRTRAERISTEDLRER